MNDAIACRFSSNPVNVCEFDYGSVCVKGAIAEKGRDSNETKHYISERQEEQQICCCTTK